MYDVTRMINTINYGMDNQDPEDPEDKSSIMKKMLPYLRHVARHTRDMYIRLCMEAGKLDFAKYEDGYDHRPGTYRFCEHCQDHLPEDKRTSREDRKEHKDFLRESLVNGYIGAADIHFPII